MIRSINTIVEEINTRISSQYSNETLYNIAVLQQDENGRTFPMARQNADNGYQISPLDTNGLQIYHRQTDSVEIKPIEGAKGKKSYQLAIYSMKLVGVGYRPNITIEEDWNNTDIANDVMGFLGKNAFLSGKEILQVNGQAITDKLLVLNEEFAGHDLSNRTLELIAFSIDYNIQQKQICFGDVTTELSSVQYTNNYQEIDVSDVDASLGNSFQDMTPSVSPSSATITYSFSMGGVGLSIDPTTGVITEGTWEDIPLGLNTATVSIIGNGSYGGSLSFVVVYSKNKCKIMTQSNYDALTNTDDQMYYLILDES